MFGALTGVVYFVVSMVTWNSMRARAGNTEADDVEEDLQMTQLPPGDDRHQAQEQDNNVDPGENVAAPGEEAVGDVNQPQLAVQVEEPIVVLEPHNDAPIHQVHQDPMYVEPIELANIQQQGDELHEVVAPEADVVALFAELPWEDGIYETPLAVSVTTVPVQLTENTPSDQVSLASEYFDPPSLGNGMIVFLGFTPDGSIVDQIQAAPDVFSDPVRWSLFRNAIPAEVRQQINRNWIMGLLPAETAAHIQRLHMEGDSEQILNLLDGLIQNNPVLDTDESAVSTLLIEDIITPTHGADEPAVVEALANLKRLTDSLGLTGPVAQMLGYIAKMGPTDVLRISMVSLDNSENFAFTRASLMNPENDSVLARIMKEILTAAQNGTHVMAEVVHSSATPGLGRGNQNVSPTTPAPLVLPAFETQGPHNQLRSDENRALLAKLEQIFRPLLEEEYLGMGDGDVPHSNIVKKTPVVHPERMPKAGVEQTPVGRKRSTPQLMATPGLDGEAQAAAKSTDVNDLAAITSGASEGMGVGMRQSVEEVPEPQQAAMFQNKAAPGKEAFKQPGRRTSHGGFRMSDKTGSAWSKQVSKGSRELPTNFGASKPSKQSTKEAIQPDKIKFILNENRRNVESIITSLTRVIEQGDEIQSLLVKPGVVLPDFLRKQVPTPAYFAKLKALKEEQSIIFNLLVKELKKDSPSDISDITDKDELSKIRKETLKAEELLSKITTSLSTADASLKKRIAEELEKAQRLTDAQLIAAVISENAGLSTQTEQAQDIQAMVGFVLGGDNLPGAPVPELQDSQAALENGSHHSALVAAITEGMTSQQVAIGASLNQSLVPRDIDEQCTALLARGYVPALVAMVREACMKIIAQQSGEVLVVGHTKNGFPVISFISSLQEMQNILFTLLQENPQGLTLGMFSFEQAGALSLYLEEVARVGGQILDAASLINDMQRLPMNPVAHQIEGVTAGHAVGRFVGSDWVVRPDFNQALTDRAQEMRVAAGTTQPIHIRDVLEFTLVLQIGTNRPSQRSQLEIEGNANLGLPASVAPEMPLAISGGVFSVSVPRGLGHGLRPEAYSAQEVELPESEEQPVEDASSHDNSLSQQGSISDSRGLKHGLQQKVNSANASLKQGQRSTNQLGQQGGVMKSRNENSKRATAKAKQPGEAELKAALGIDNTTSKAGGGREQSRTQPATKFSVAAVALDQEFNTTQKNYIGANGKLISDKENFRAEIDRLRTMLANQALLISESERNRFQIKLAEFSQCLKTAEAIQGNRFMTEGRGVNAEMERINDLVMNQNQRGTIQHELNDLRARYDQGECNNLDFRRELENISQKLVQIEKDVEQIRIFLSQSSLRAARQDAIYGFLRDFDQNKRSLHSTIVQLGNMVKNREQLRTLVSNVQAVVEKAPPRAVLSGVIAALTGSPIGLITRLLDSRSNRRGGLLLSGTDTVATAGASNSQMVQSIREMCLEFAQSTGANEESIAEIEAGLLEVANATNPRESRLVILTVGPDGQTFLDLRADRLNQEVTARIVEGMARGDQIIVRLLPQRLAARLKAVMQHATHNNMRLQNTAHAEQLIGRIQSGDGALNPVGLLRGLTAESDAVSLGSSSENLDESVEQHLAEWRAEPEVDDSYSMEQFVNFVAVLLLVAQMQAAQTEAQQRAVMGMLGYLVQAAQLEAENQASNALENGAGAGSDSGALSTKDLEQLERLRRLMEIPSNSPAGGAPLSEEQIAQLWHDANSLLEPQRKIEAEIEAQRGQPSPGQSGAGGQPSPAPAPASTSGSKGSDTVPRKPVELGEPHPLDMADKKPKSPKGPVPFNIEDKVIRDQPTSRFELPDELLQYSKILDAIVDIRNNTPKLRKEHGDELDRLHATLGASMMHYLDDKTHNNKMAFDKFYKTVMKAVANAEKQFKNEGVLWNLIRPILNAVIQVVNAIGKAFGAKKEFGLFKSAATQAWEGSEAVEKFKAVLQEKYGTEEPTPTTKEQKPTRS